MSIKTNILDQINGPTEVKKLTIDEMSELATEMREKILQKNSAIGGHVGPNLGVVELTIAFHHVFDSPKDKIVWDVSHQSYGHKLLTGRKNGFEEEATTKLAAIPINMKVNMIILLWGILQLRSV